MKYPDGLGFSVAGKRKRSPEYPCVSRFRQRRLLSFLLCQNLFHTYDALIGESDVFMDLEHLNGLVKAGRWDEAIKYLSRFLPSDRLLGVQGRALFHFLRVHKAIDDIVSGATESRAVSAALKKCFTLDFTPNHAITKLRAILWSLLCSSGLRDSLDLGHVRDKAASIIVDLVCRTPELKEHMTDAHGPMKPHNVLPIGFGFRPRRHVKRGPIPGSVLVRHYLHKRRMLPSSTSSHCEGLSFELLIKAKEWMVNLVDTSLEAGKRHQGYRLQSVCNKGAPVGPVSQTNLGTFRSPARHSGMSSDTDLVLKAKEWTVYLTDERLEAWPDLSQGYPFQSVDKDGFPVARVSKTMPDALSRPAESSAISSVTKADAPSLLQVLHPLKGPARDYGNSPVTNAGALPSQAMSAIWAYPYEHSLMSTVTNAGALSSEAMSAIWASPSFPSEYPLPCLLLANAGALPSEAMSAIWASPSENSLISTVTNAGTHKQGWN